MGSVYPGLAALAAALAASLVPFSAARAEDKSPLRVRVGLGAEWAPRFPGADDNRLGPMVDVSIARDNEPFAFEAPDDSFDIGLVSTERFSAGAVANLQSSRKNDDVGAAVGKVPTTLELGAFAQVQPIDRWRVRAELRRGIGGHDGMIASMGVDYVWRDGDRFLVSIGPRATIADGRYQRAYYGIGPAASAATGLPVYRPGAGLQSVGAAAGMNASIKGPWGLFGYARYERLAGDAHRSPLIKRYGSSNQYSAGIGLSYSFSIRR